MAWYKAGTVSCAQNSSTVTGQGTDFAANCRVGDAFIGPDGRWYEVINVPSASVLAIDPAYAGPSVDAARYSVMPVQGYNRDSATALRQATNEFTEGTSGASESAAQAEQSAAQASQSQKAADTAATTATQKAGVAETAASTASQQAQAAASSRQAADNSAGAAGQSANDAKGYRDQAAQSAASIDTTKLVQKAGDSMTGALNFAPPVNVADSATPDIVSAAANTLVLYGSTTITGFPAGSSGMRKRVIFELSRVLKYSSSLILLGNADMTAAGNDWAEFECFGGTTWRMVSYQRAGNTPSIQTQNNTDATPGRLMRVGDFGISAYGIALAASVDLNTLFASGRYTCGAGNNPNAPTVIGYLDVIAHQAGNISKQIWYEFYGQGIWTRYSQNGSWGAWTPQYHRGNVLGTVSQASGVPTGALFEQGSNSNGKYIRFANGVQICHGSTALGASVAANNYIDIAVTFAASFADNNYTVSASFDPASSWDYYGFLSRYSATVSGCTLRGRNGATAQAFLASYTAIGRWF